MLLLNLDSDRERRGDYSPLLVLLAATAVSIVIVGWLIGPVIVFHARSVAVFNFGRYLSNDLFHGPGYADS